MRHKTNTSTRKYLARRGSPIEGIFSNHFPKGMFLRAFHCGILSTATFPFLQYNELGLDHTNWLLSVTQLENKTEFHRRCHRELRLTVVSINKGACMSSGPSHWLDEEACLRPTRAYWFNPISFSFAHTQSRIQDSGWTSHASRYKRFRPKWHVQVF